MEIIITIKPMLNCMGLMFKQSSNFYYKLYGAFWFFATFLFIIPEMAYFYVHLDDVVKASDAIIFIAAQSMTVIKLLFFYFYKTKYSRLLNRLQNNVNEKNKQKRLKHYIDAEDDVKLFTRFYYTLFIVGIHLGIALPMVVVVYNYLIGQLTPDIWYLPYPIILFYDTKNTPGFEITYCIIGIAVIGVVCNFCSIDSLFVGICIHLRAICRELLDIIIELDAYANHNENSLLFHSVNDKKEMLLFKKKLANCIQHQEFLTSCFNNFEEVNSGIIFTQFCGTILILCASVFQMTTSFQGGKILSYINLWGCYLAQLFVYAFYGNMLSTELTKISITIYSSSWYRRPPIVRKQFFLMILNAQVDRYLKGLHYLNCSMENLSAVLRASASAAALLKSVKEKL